MVEEVRFDTTAAATTFGLYEQEESGLLWPLDGLSRCRLGLRGFAAPSALRSRGAERAGSGSSFFMSHVQSVLR